MLNAISVSTGTLTVALGRPDVIVATCDVSGVAPGAAACAVDLPAGAESLWVQADDRLRTTVSSVGVALDAPPPAEACELRARRAVVDGAQVLYVTDGLVYAKRRGVWVLGGAEGHFVASGTGATKLRLQNGPVKNHIAIWNSGWRDDWDAQPGGFRDVQIPRPKPGDDPTFTIAATAGFDSGAADPGIRGHRSLGVWVSLQDFGKPATSYSSTRSIAHDLGQVVAKVREPRVGLAQVPRAVQLAMDDDVARVAAVEHLEAFEAGEVPQRAGVHAPDRRRVVAVAVHARMPVERRLHHEARVAIELGAQS